MMTGPELYVLVLICFTIVISIQVQEKYFSIGWPPLIYEDRDSLSIDNIQAKSSFHCASVCMEKGCKTFLFKETDTKQEHCFNTTIPQKYAEPIDTAYNNFSCGAWSSDHYWKNRTTDLSFPDGSIEAAQNYCRDPLPSGYLWCAKDDADSTEWDTCNIPRCMTNGSFKQVDSNADCDLKAHSALLSACFKLSPIFKTRDKLLANCRLFSYDFTLARHVQVKIADDIRFYY